ncbi:Hypp4757 [Branchiostoma lanceolatum]|uniref:Hypp4757 protein n=1 Tax=Branchiostoma lanceolatum TaxID=7740 RepID=A0A8K0F2P7_BRALA|nr:Hypp4757 [Branchiostoma lanceolatum]
METTPWTTDSTGIWMTEATPEASVPRLTRSSGQTTPGEAAPPPPVGSSAGLVAGVVIGVLALILLGVVFFILKKRGIIFNRDDAGVSAERTDPEGEGDTFKNLLRERRAGNRSQGDPLPIPNSNNYTSPPERPGRRTRPAHNVNVIRSQEDPLPIPDDDNTYLSLLDETGERPALTGAQGDALPIPDDDNTYLSLLDETGERPALTGAQGGALPMPDDNTYLSLVDETESERRNQNRSQEDTTYINLHEETREKPIHSRRQGDPLPTPDDDTYTDLIEATRERSLPVPDNNTYTSLLNQQNQPDGAESTYLNVRPGHAQRVQPYANVDFDGSPRPYANVDFDGSAQSPPSPHVSESQHEMANLEGSTYENCSPSYGNVDADGNAAEASFMNHENADNLYEDVNRDTSLYSDCEPTYANQ